MFDYFTQAHKGGKMSPLLSLSFEETCITHANNNALETLIIIVNTSLASMQREHDMYRNSEELAKKGVLATCEKETY